MRLNAARRDATLTLYPDRNDPIPNQGVKAQLEEARQELERRRALLDSADDAHRAGGAGRRHPAGSRHCGAGSVAGSGVGGRRSRPIARWKPYLYIPQDSPYWRATTEMKTEIESLLKQYAAGMLDGENLIRQLDQRFQLLFLEQ